MPLRAVAGWAPRLGGRECPLVAREGERLGLRTALLEKLGARAMWKDFVGRGGKKSTFLKSGERIIYFGAYCHRPGARNNG